MYYLDLINYCKDNDLCTRASLNQYNTILDLAKFHNRHDIACMIWICSITEKTICEIENDLLFIKEQYNK